MEQIPWAQFNLWMEYGELEPFGANHESFQTAIQTSTLGSRLSAVQRTVYGLSGKRPPPDKTDYSPMTFAPWLALDSRIQKTRTSLDTPESFRAFRDHMVAVSKAIQKSRKVA